MIKRNKILLMIIFLAFFVLFFHNTEIAFAETNTANSLILKFQVPIPGGPAQIDFRSGENHIGNYISTVYSYAISIVGIVATIMLMFGGFTWLTAGGSGDKVGKARDIIFGSLTGLILALTSYTILNLINPGLVNFKPAVVTPADDTLKPSVGHSTGCCLYNLTMTGTATECKSGVTKKSCDDMPKGSGSGNRYIGIESLKCNYSIPNRPSCTN